MSSASESEERRWEYGGRVTNARGQTLWLASVVLLPGMRSGYARPPAVSRRPRYTGVTAPRRYVSSRVSPLSSRNSHAFAFNHSRLTVMADTPSTSAVSSALSPPK